MTWQGYVDNLMTANYIMDAAICGISCGTVWASTPGLKNISVDEIKKLNTENHDFAQNGVYIGGQRCRLLRDQLNVEGVYALQLKTAADSEGSTFGMCVGKSLKAFVIVKGTKEANGGQLSEKTYTMVKHLRDANS